MYTFKPTVEQQDTFNTYFDRLSYYQAVAWIYESAAMCDTFTELFKALHGYDQEYPEDFEEALCDDNSFYCETELDRSYMETDADFVSVEFLIVWDNTTSAVTIENAALYVSDHGQICQFDPHTLEITEWG